MSKYSKPNILFQPMNLFANISASCANGIDHGDETSCAVNVTKIGTTVFTSHCNDTDTDLLIVGGLIPPTGGDLEGDFDENDGTCFHVPYGSSSSVFMS
jgi:hypothetical protein